MDGAYTIYGKVIKGMDVVDAVVRVARDSLDQPLTPITIDVNILMMTAGELNGYDFDFD